MDCDSALEEVGPFGRYQKIILILLCIPCSFPAAYLCFSQVFVAASPDHWCTVPQLSNFSVDVQKNVSIPIVRKDGENQYGKCQMYDVDYGAVAWEIQQGQQPQPNSSWPVSPCQYGWTYDQTYYESTLVTEFDLVCDKNWLPAFSTSLFYIGGLPGLFLLGWVTDRFGRRIALITTIAGTLIVPFISAFSVNYTMYCALRFIMGIFFPAIFQVPFIICLEITTPKYRTVVGMLPCVIFGFGVSTLAGLAYATRNWSSLIIATTAPFTFLLTYWWIIPESPRWLLSQGANKKAEEFFYRAAKVNNKSLPENFFRKHTEELQSFQSLQGESVFSSSSEINKIYTVVDLFRWPNLRLKTILVAFIWTINAIVYTGISYMATILGVDDYLSFAITSLMEVPSSFVAWYVMEKWGRRWTTCGFMIIVGILSVSTMFVPGELTWLTVTLASGGKFFITATFCIIYVFGTELLPTVLRGVGMGFYSIVSNIFVVTSPYIVFMSEHSRTLPMVIMGVLSAVAGLATLLLPETVGRTLPQTIEEGELMKNHLDDILCLRRRKRNEDSRNSSKNHSYMNGNDSEVKSTAI